MAWFRVAKGRLEYRGRITRAPFAEWCATKDGVAAVARAAAGIRFSLLGRERAARRRTWLALEGTARVAEVAAAIRAEAAHYLSIFASLSYADALPRANVALHRLVVVPRSMIAARARAALFGRLQDAAPLSGLDAGVRVFLLDRLLAEMDAAIQEAAPSPRHPILAREEWACVGVTKDLVWVDPLYSGADGAGHVFMFELPRAGLGRTERKALERAMAELRDRASALTRLQRTDLVRAAQNG